MTIALKLDASGYSVLQAEASELGMSPEQLANEIVQRHLRARAVSAEDPAFQAALAASMKENEVLLRRLAK